MVELPKTGPISKPEYKNAFLIIGMQPGVIRLEPFGIGSGYGIGSGELLLEAWTCAKSSESKAQRRH